MNNDDSILYHGFHVRDTVGDDPRLLNALLDWITNADLKVAQEFQVREYVLHTIFKVYQRKRMTSNGESDFEKSVQRVLKLHIVRLNEAFN